MQQGIHQRAFVSGFFLARAGVYAHAGGLVDHYQALVFVNHIQGNVFRKSAQRQQLHSASDLDLLASVQAQRGLG